MNRKSKIVFLVLLSALCSMTSAATVEKPVYTFFKDIPVEENVVLGYVQFGQLADGSPAIQKVNEVTVRFFTRNTFPKLNYDGFLYSAEELDCKKGMVQLIGAGIDSVDRITAMEDPPKASSVSVRNPKNLPVYREACTSLGIRPYF